MNILRTGLTVCLLFASLTWVWAKKSMDIRIHSTFSRMKIALQTKNQELFTKQWHPIGYQTNLVGGSGVPGRGVYSQGSRKRWYLRPNFEKQISLTNRVVIVPCDIWSWQKKRPVDRVHAVVVRQKARWLVLGAGERSKEVVALANRYIHNKPLPPQKK